MRVVPADSLDANTAQTPGMDRKAAINFARVGAQKLWAGTVHIHPNAKTGAHHHGHLESVIYIVRGRARMRWGEHLEFTAEAGPGDFIYVPPYVPHQEINASPTEVLECVLCRSDGQAVAVNLDIEPVEKPEQVLWVDPTHPHALRRTLALRRADARARHAAVPGNCRVARRPADSHAEHDLPHHDAHAVEPVVERARRRVVIDLNEAWEARNRITA